MVSVVASAIVSPFDFEFIPEDTDFALADVSGASESINLSSERVDDAGPGADRGRQMRYRSHAQDASTIALQKPENIFWNQLHPRIGNISIALSPCCDPVTTRQTVHLVAEIDILDACLGTFRIHFMTQQSVKPL